MYISTIDWNAKTNKIISGSYDKNIYVWSFNEERNEWTPSLVIFKHQLSVLSVKWNTEGDKFAAASTTNKLIIGNYDNEVYQWWKGEVIKVHKSAISCISFDPSGMFILSGSTDLKAMIHSCYLEELDKNKINNNFPSDLTKVSILIIVFIAFFYNYKDSI